MLNGVGELIEIDILELVSENPLWSNIETTYQIEFQFTELIIQNGFVYFNFKASQYSH